MLTIAADAQGVATARTQQASEGAPSQTATAGYKALVKLKTQHFEAQDEGALRKFALEAGMQTGAEIHPGANGDRVFAESCKQDAAGSREG